MLLELCPNVFLQLNLNTRLFLVMFIAVNSAVLFRAAVVASDSTLQPVTKDHFATQEDGNQEESEEDEKQTRLNKYFNRFCDYTGGLDNMSVDYAFRQQLKKTKDEELKRLFVLKHLYREVRFDMDDYVKEHIRIGKTEIRSMTDKEKSQAKEKILQKLDDLEMFDPGDPKGEIAEHRNKLK